MPVRVSLPLDSGRMPPSRNGVEYTCAAGIIRYVLEKERDPYKYIDYSFDSNLPPDIQELNKSQQSGDKTPFFQSILNLIRELF
jgi:cell division protein FtsA